MGDTTSTNAASPINYASLSAVPTPGTVQTKVVLDGKVIASKTFPKSQSKTSTSNAPLSHRRKPRYRSRRSRMLSRQRRLKSLLNRLRRTRRRIRRNLKKIPRPHLRRLSRRNKRSQYHRRRRPNSRRSRCPPRHGLQRRPHKTQSSP